MFKIDYEDAKIEHLSELRLSKKYEETLPEGVYFEFCRWHDHSCCSDCCGCDEEYSQFMTAEDWMRG